MEKLFKVLRFFRLTDESNVISLTNLALMAGIYKILVTNATSMNDVGLFLLPLLNYAHKRVVNNKEEK